MIDYILRVLRMLTRLVAMISNLGFLSALKIMVYGVIFDINKQFTMKTKNFGLLHWHPRKDKVICHLYTPQIEIYSPSGKLKITSIVDLGANIGIETIRFAKLYPLAKILAIEAEQRNYEVLQLNTSMLDSVNCFNIAIWDKPAKLNFSQDSESAQSWFLVEAENDEAAQIIGTPFDNFLKERKIKNIDILKVDIEGAEYELFSNNINDWIHFVKVVIMECPDSDRPGTLRYIFQKLSSVNYNFNSYIHGENIILVRADLDWEVCSREIY